LLGARSFQHHELTPEGLILQILYHSTCFTKGVGNVQKCLHGNKMKGRLIQISDHSQ